MSGPDFQPPGSSGGAAPFGAGSSSGQQRPPQPQPGQGPPQPGQAQPQPGQGPPQPQPWQGPPQGPPTQPQPWQGPLPQPGQVPPPGQGPPAGPAWRPPGGSPPPRGGGSILLGLLVGLVVLFGGGWVFFAVADRLGDAAGFVGLLLPVAYLGGSITLAVRESTRRFGSGLLLAIGAALIILAGVCFGLLFMMAGH